MKYCPELHAYSDGRLTDMARAEFERHLSGCAECKKALALQTAIREELTGARKELSFTRTPEDAAAARQLLSRVQESQRHRGWSGVFTLGRVAVFAVLVIGLAIALVFGPLQRDDITSLKIHRLLDETNVSAALEPSLGEPIVVPSGERIILEIQEDRVGVAEKTQVVVLDASRTGTRIQLVEGSVACAVTPQEQRTPFIIEAGPPEVEKDGFRIEVKGTRFMVRGKNREEWVVVVEEGVVQVSHPRHGEVDVIQGNRLLASTSHGYTFSNLTAEERQSLDDLLRLEAIQPRASSAEENESHQLSPGEVSSDEVSSDEHASVENNSTEIPTGMNSDPPKNGRSRASRRGPSLATLQQLVLDGHYQEAEKELAVRVEKNPQTADAWFLLADCQKKQRQYRRAAQTYQKAATVLPARAANTARYRAGAMMQDQLNDVKGALAMFNEFIEMSPRNHHLEPSAKLRLALLLLSSGKRERAKNLLKEIVTKHQGSMAAVEAQKLLSQ